MIENRDNIKEILEKELNISRNSFYSFDQRIEPTSIGPDITIQDGGVVYYINVNRKADWNSIARLFLFRELGEKNARLVLMSRVIPSSIHNQTGRIGVTLINLPRSFNIKDDEKRTHGKVTSVLAWKLIYGLIVSDNRSIRDLSRTEKVSYAWSHQVIDNLITQGIAERNGNRVYLKNLPSLLNAVAWERPFNKLEMERIVTDFDSTMDLARTISGSDPRDNLIFCGYLAATLHFGIGIRSDLIQAYILDNDTIDQIRSDYSNNSKRGVSLYLYSPDRDIGKGSLTRSGVRITSREQTVLDLAGMGYQSRDVLDPVVKKIGTHR